MLAIETVLVSGPDFQRWLNARVASDQFLTELTELLANGCGAALLGVQAVPAIGPAALSLMRPTRSLARRIDSTNRTIASAMAPYRQASWANGRNRR